MINRIIEIRKENNLSQEKFADKLNLSRNFINQVEAGKKNLSDRSIADICESFLINEEWLRYGTGDKKSFDARNLEVQKFVNDALKGVDDSIKKRMMFGLARLDDNDWDAIDRILNKLINK